MPDPSLTTHPPFRPQVAYGAPVKAFKASAFSVKAARRTGVVAMSAATDDIINVALLDVGREAAQRDRDRANEASLARLLAHFGRVG